MSKSLISLNLNISYNIIDIKPIIDEILKMEML